MSLATPSNIRELQIKLYRKAKNEPEFRFYQLYDKIYREDVLNHAYALAKANDGAPGVDQQSFEDIESAGLAEWRNDLREDLRNKTYVRGERAGQRVMESITRFITQQLKLKVNEAKSAVSRPQERKFLGFSFTNDPEVKRTIAPKAVDRFQVRVREITRRASVWRRRWTS